MWFALGIAFKAVAMAMAMVTVAFIILDEGDAGTWGIFLAIGLFAVAVGSMMHHQKRPGV